MGDDTTQASETSEAPSTTVEGLVEGLRAGAVSRRRFLAALTGMGVTAAGAAAVLAVANRTGAPTGRGSAADIEQALQLHDQHIARQVRGDAQAMLADYAEDAAVHDPLFGQPFVGKDAIARRYAAEVGSVPDRSLRILNRSMSGDELIVEWEATGTHAQDFLGFGGKGNAYTLRGVTTVVRRYGKIVRESHFYDVDELLRQIEA